MSEVEKPKKEKKKAVSKSEKAGLIWPISKVHRRCVAARSGQVKRTSVSAPVYISAVAEFAVGEILALACQITQNDKRKRITAKDVLQAVRADREINKMTRGLRVLVGDRLRDVSLELLPSASKKAKLAEKQTAKPVKANAEPETGAK